MRCAVAGALLLAALAAAGAHANDDPSEVEPPPADAPPADAPPADAPPAEAPPTDAPPTDAPPTDAPPTDAPSTERRPVDDRLVSCRVLILDERFDDAERCLTQALAAPDVNPADARRARALLEVVGAWKAHLGAAGPAVAPGPISTAEAAGGVDMPHEQVSLSALVADGAGEAVVQGALAGGGAGFLVSAAIASATRASEADTIGWLVAAPAAGAVAGAAGSYALVRVLQPNLGDLRLATSTMWMGAVQGFTLQLAVFDQSPDVGAVPLRFVTVLAGGALGLGAGTALGPLLDVEDGDVAVADSAALWGGVMSSIALIGLGGSGVGLSTPVAVAIVAGGIGVPWVAALAAHELLTIERWPSFLIDAGGAAGLLISGATLAAFGSAMGGSAALVSVVVGTGVLAGVTVGTMAATLTSDAVRAEARVLERDRELAEGVE